MTKAEVAKVIGGEPIDVPIYDSLGNQTGFKTMTPEVNLDSFYKFRIKEEVIFDKESSRLFWRILGIAPLKRVITSSGVDLGQTELFWVYYPDMRPIFAKYEVYNPKNDAQRLSWEDVFEARIFESYIYKESNVYDRNIQEYATGMDALLESDRVKYDIFTFEHDLWNY